MQTLLVKGTYSKYLCKVGTSGYRFESCLPDKEKIKKISFLKFFCYIYNVRRYTEGKISLRRLKIQTANVFSICTIYVNQENRILFLQTQKRKYKGSYSKIFFDDGEYSQKEPCKIS